MEKKIKKDEEEELEHFGGFWGQTLLGNSENVPSRALTLLTLSTRVST